VDGLNLLKEEASSVYLWFKIFTPDGRGAEHFTLVELSSLFDEAELRQLGNPEEGENLLRSDWRLPKVSRCLRFCVVSLWEGGLVLRSLRLCQRSLEVEVELCFLFRLLVVGELTLGLNLKRWGMFSSGRWLS